MRLIILGPPGSGKTSLAELLARKFSLKMISIGGMLRKEIKNKTEIGTKIEKIINKGDLVPNKIVLDLLKKSLGTRKDNVLFDGFPRDMKEMEALNRQLKVDKAIYLDASEKVILMRLSNRRVCACGMNYNLITKKPKKNMICDKCRRKLLHREDDKPKAIKERLRVYNKETKPVLEHYKKKGILYRIDGDNNTRKVLIEAIKKIKKNDF